MSSKQANTKTKAGQAAEQDSAEEDGSQRSNRELRGEARQAKHKPATKSDTKRRDWDTNVESDVSSENSITKKAQTEVEGGPSKKPRSESVESVDEADEASGETPEPSPSSGAAAGVAAGFARARNWVGDKFRDVASRADADTADDDADEAFDAVDADDMSRFLDSRRPWLRPITKRDRRRRLGGLYWAMVYVLLMAGATSLIGFVVVRGYLILWPGPTSSGTTVARQVVPWVFFALFLVFTAYVTRSVARTLGYALLFLLPYLVFLFVREATDLAVWLVGWIPGNTQVYGLAALGPFIAFVLLGRDFVRWQLWVEFPNDACWECGTIIGGESWAFCPTCSADLQEQRFAEAEDESAAVAEAAEVVEVSEAASDDEIDISDTEDDGGPFDLEAEDAAPAESAAGRRSASAAER